MDRWCYPLFDTLLTSPSFPLINDALDLKESYRAHWKKYIKSAKRSSVPAGDDPALVASRLNIEKEYCSAIKKVDQKIDMASRLYELVSGTSD